ncbi:MAG: dihydroorotate dehydrogenase-like protein [Myxococcota bacterium]|jgi:dihydroorotate dehydrogenase (fumarate)|nr:dihydroorotate dehydrogenase-like protein [Myxococcota bacterium]
MADLSTQYLGLSLRSPLVVSSSPLCKTVENLRLMENAGAGAVVLHSLYEEQIIEEANELDERLSAGTESFAEALDYFPPASSYRMTPEIYLDHVAAAKKALSIPVIASLNGASNGGWVRYAKKLEDAGADALELNLYSIPADTAATAASVEKAYVELVGAVASSVKIPVAIKIGPFFTALLDVAKRFESAGAKGLVIFNRFYQPDLDIEALETSHTLNLSNSNDLLLRLRWAGILFGRVGLDLGITGGVHSASDAVKSVMAGASVAMMTSALLSRGIDHLATVRAGFDKWAENHEYESVAQMRGAMSQKNVADPTAFERATYIKVLNAFR